MYRPAGVLDLLEVSTEGLPLVLNLDLVILLFYSKKCQHNTVVCTIC